MRTTIAVILAATGSAQAAVQITDPFNEFSPGMLTSAVSVLSGHGILRSIGGDGLIETTSSALNFGANGSFPPRPGTFALEGDVAFLLTLDTPAIGFGFVYQGTPPSNITLVFKLGDVEVGRAHADTVGWVNQWAEFNTTSPAFDSVYMADSGLLDGLSITIPAPATALLGLLPLTPRRRRASSPR